MVPERPELENEATLSTGLGRTLGLKGTAKASQYRYSEQGFASQTSCCGERWVLVGFVCVFEVHCWWTCQRVSKLLLSLRVKGKTWACLSRRHLRLEKSGSASRVCQLGPGFLLPRIYLHNLEPEALVAR